MLWNVFSGSQQETDMIEFDSIPRSPQRVVQKPSVASPQDSAGRRTSESIDPTDTYSAMLALYDNLKGSSEFSGAIDANTVEGGLGI